MDIKKLLALSLAVAFWGGTNAQASAETRSSDDAVVPQQRLAINEGTVAATNDSAQKSRMKGRTNIRTIKNPIDDFMTVVERDYPNIRVDRCYSRVGDPDLSLRIYGNGTDISNFLNYLRIGGHESITQTPFSIDVTQTCFSIERASFNADYLLDILSKDSKLRSLSLHEIDKSTMREFIKGLSQPKNSEILFKLRNFFVDDCCLDEDLAELASAVAKMRNLQQLEISNDGVTKFIKVLQSSGANEFSSLKILNLKDTNLSLDLMTKGDIDIKAFETLLSFMPNLQELSLRLNLPKDQIEELVSTIVRMPKLKKLELFVGKEDESLVFSLVKTVCQERANSGMTTEPLILALPGLDPYSESTARYQGRLQDLAVSYNASVELRLW